MSLPPGPAVVIEPIQPKDFPECIEIMATNDPWKRLGLTHEQLTKAVTEDTVAGFVSREVDGGPVIAFTRIAPKGFVGRNPYIRTLAVKDDCRGRGAGTQHLQFVQDVLFRDTTHIFLCCSSFNTRALEFYKRAGFIAIGEIPGFVVPHENEWLLVKTRPGYLPPPSQ